MELNSAEIFAYYQGRILLVFWVHFFYYFGANNFSAFREHKYGSYNDSSPHNLKKKTREFNFNH